MRQTQPFDPIMVGEADNFFFELTGRVGANYILDTQWTCALAGYSEGTDPNPQSRIIEATFSNQGIHYRAADGSLQFKSGFFAIAMVGGMPPSAHGATYVLSHTTRLDNKRILRDSAIVQCQLPG